MASGKQGTQLKSSQGFSFEDEKKKGHRFDLSSGSGKFFKVSPSHRNKVYTSMNKAAVFQQRHRAVRQSVRRWLLHEKKKKDDG